MTTRQNLQNKGTSARLRRGGAVAGRWLAAFVAGAGCVAGAADVKLGDGQRIAALVEIYDVASGVTVLLTSGEQMQVPLRNIASIAYSGRGDRMVRTGDLKLMFNTGGQICGAVEELKEDASLEVVSQSLGRQRIGLKVFRGGIALALDGKPALLADDLLREDGIERTPANAFVDTILDRRGVSYAGVVERLTPVRLEFEHDEQLQPVKMETFKVAAIRLAEAASDRQPPPDPVDVLQVGVLCRDRSYVVGTLDSVSPFQWKIRPAFDPGRVMVIPSGELVQADVLGGQVVFLAAMDPVRVEEKTIIAPSQSFRRNANSQGESLDIGGYLYRRGIGVHAGSKLTYKLDGKFKTFAADAAIDGRLEKNGSVIFTVLGDGRELYRSTLVTGHVSGGGLAIRVPVDGVRELTLVVDPTEDLDQADVADWGAARVIR